MINFKQLHYFWRVAKAGSIARAATQLRLAPQTISAQINTLEEQLGSQLFRRVGRGLELTPAGELTLSYADEIFQIGRELEANLRNQADGKDILFRVGVADVVPKSIAYRLLAPGLTAGRVRMVCREDKLERLFAEIAVHRLDLVIADRPLPPALGVKGHSHSLGRTRIAFFAAAELAERYGPGFPQSLSGAPMLIAGEGSTMQMGLTRWFSEQGIEPRIVGEFEDSALMKAFGQAGMGIFPAPAVLAGEMAEQFEATLVGEVEGITTEYFAISVERKLSHPAVVAISEAAKTDWGR
ncbi:transcriptional activator NhaR [Phreatobacter sp.]|uniref:transcriptional activator NhaR n=1 Tax=Phreatobacter sp. TaxID=1966341 RepID=UPI0022C41943|nr:transcriptional activator NhaR [Phreatobacter sp.]MCZ8313396.1 transcriptional activator NhaR [Phreatobacter sp.]